jgi:predicted nuclease with TOPRIM domain
MNSLEYRTLKRDINSINDKLERLSHQVSALSTQVHNKFEEFEENGDELTNVRRRMHHLIEHYRTIIERMEHVENGNDILHDMINPAYPWE